ncbi:MAG: hypothetical protein AABW89_06070 [Nanoarchaeota archaeon]
MNMHRFDLEQLLISLEEVSGEIRSKIKDFNSKLKELLIKYPN